MLSRSWLALGTLEPYTEYGTTVSEGIPIDIRYSAIEATAGLTESVREPKQTALFRAQRHGNGRVVPKYRSDGPVRGLVEKAFRFPRTLLVSTKNRPLQFFLFLLPLQSIPSPLP